MIILFTAADVGDTGAEFDRVFLQELRDLKVFVNDKDIVEEHKRWRNIISMAFGARGLQVDLEWTQHLFQPSSDPCSLDTCKMEHWLTEGGRSKDVSIDICFQIGLVEIINIKNGTFTSV